jgi:hypothetical protein
MLSRALTEVGRNAEWRHVLGELGIAREVAFGLARYLTVFVPSVGGPHSLLAQCLAAGLDSWRDSIAARSQFERYHAYLRGLLEPLPQVLEWTVCIRSGAGEVYWDPMRYGLLECWRETRGVIDVTRRDRPRDSAYVDVAPWDFRFLVLVRFLARRELRLAPLAPHFSELVCRYG